MITNKQKENILKLSNNDLKEILYICIEGLGVCDIEESCNVLMVQRSRIYQLMKEETTLKLGKHTFLMVSEVLNSFKNQ